jgi:glutamate/aspartate transport system substrate-binding protein
LCLSGAALAVGAAEPAGTLKKIHDQNTITLGVRDASIPFSYLDDKQEAVGYSVDLCMKVVAAVRGELKLPNLQVKKQVVTSSNRIPLMANGTVDIECGSTVNNIERQKLVAFSLTTFIVNTKLIVPKSSPVHGLQDLKGRPVAATAGTNTMQKLNEINSRLNPGMTLQQGKDHGETFLLVQTGRAAAFAEDDILLAGLAANTKTPGDYRLVAIDGMAADPYALMLRKDDPQFKVLVDSALRAVFASGEIEKLYDKWFVKPIPPRGITLSFPMSEQWKRAVHEPTDSGDPRDYN